MKTRKLIVGIGVALALAGSGGVTADKLQNPYADKGATLEIARNSTVPGVGEIKDVVSETEPKITLSKWNGEVRMGVKYQGIPSATSGSRPFLSKNVEWSSSNQKMEAVPVDASLEMEDGGMEINIVLASQPSSNVFDFQLDNYQNLDFRYQEPLTLEQINNGFYQPDNVIGSYAVYYKGHKDYAEGQTNYATGKAYHIYRPKATDNKGKTVWAILSYNDGVLSVTVPQDFLDTASYPVKVDPLFGYTTLGASSTSQPSNTFWSDLGTTTVQGTVVSLTAGVSNGATGSFKGVLVDGTAKTILTNGVSPATSFTTKNFYTSTYVSAPTVSANTGYWIGVVIQTNSSLYYDSGCNDLLDSGTNNYTTPTDPTGGVSNHGTTCFSAYITYNQTGCTGICLVADVAVGGNGSTATTAAINTTGANFCVAVASYYTNSADTVSDSKSNTWTELTRYTNAAFQRVVIWYAKNPTVGSGHTFTLGSGASTFPAIAAACFSGVDTSSPFDQENGSANTKTPGSVTPTQNNELIITGISTLTGAGTTPTVDSGFTVTGAHANSASNYTGYGLAYKIQTTAAAVNPTWSSTDTNWATDIATFKATQAAAVINSPSFDLKAGAELRGLLNI